jgi:hypothetical protein
VFLALRPSEGDERVLSTIWFFHHQDSKHKDKDYLAVYASLNGIEHNKSGLYRWELNYKDSKKTRERLTQWLNKNWQLALPWVERHDRHEGWSCIYQEFGLDQKAICARRNTNPEPTFDKHLPVPTVNYERKGDRIHHKKLKKKTSEMKSDNDSHKKSKKNSENRSLKKPKRETPYIADKPEDDKDSESGASYIIEESDYDEEPERGASYMRDSPGLDEPDPTDKWHPGGRAANSGTAKVSKMISHKRKYHPRI